MDASHNGSWHTALPLRPPTVDEALPYTPLTSIVPFSPDIIPFPSAEPPTPPTTLTAEQQSAARRAVHVLNGEAKGPASASGHLQQTIRGLQHLLDPTDLPSYNFKPVTQLTSPPPESASTQENGSAATKALSPFARMLLKETKVAFVNPGVPPPRPSMAQPSPQLAPRPHSQSHMAAPNLSIHNKRASSHHVPSSTPSTPSVPAPLRPGPAVVVKHPPPGLRRDEYRRFDAPAAAEGPPKKKQRAENEKPAMKAREREIADLKMRELYNLLDEIAEGRDMGQRGCFAVLDTEDGPLRVLKASTLAQLSDSVLRVVNFGCFPLVPTKQVLLLQSFCEPLIRATGQLPLFLEGIDGEELVGRLSSAQHGLRACKLVLQTMTEGCDDRQICSEDLVQAVSRLLKHVLNSCITPAVECRRSGSSSALFALVSQNKNDVFPVLRLCGSIFSQIAALIGKIKMTGFTLSPIEAVSIDIIFAQNGERETESALGIQKFESFRQKAMDVLAQIFACHLEQRDSITSEILNNLERLPDKRASARHFKSAREAPIMLVSALFMRMIQAAASNASEQDDAPAAVPDTDDSEEDDSEHDRDSDGNHRQSKARKASNKSRRTPRQIASQLEQGARGITQHIASTLVARAENVSKSGDKPFRNLLDLFIEDLCNVLGSPEWPAASILLETLLAIMIQFTQSTKEKGVQAADMALSAMGSMGVGIIDFTARVKHVKRGLDISQSDLASKLVPLADDALKNNINVKDVLGLDGPYRVVLESLPSYLSPQGSHASQDDPHLRSLRGYYATFWSNALYKAFKDGERDGHTQQFVAGLEKHLKNLITDPNWFSKEYSFQDVTDSESKLAAGIIALHEPFCQYLPNLISILLGNTHNHSAKVKSRAMTSLTQMIEKDPQILDDKTFPGLARLIGDSSPLVRENIISLISKCIEQNPSLEQHCLQGILNLMTDPANGPKKKAIKLLKDIYMSTTERDKKVRIATELLLPILDDEKAIADLTRQTFEDVWLAPLRSDSRIDENQLKLDRANRVSLLIFTVQNIQARPTHLQAFEAFFTKVLLPTSKNAAENFKICKQMVADMVEDVIDTDSSAAENSQARILQTLAIFAKVSPKLFTVDQVQLLKLYVKSLGTTEDLAVFRPTVIIFRYVFPALSGLQPAFLEEVRDSLMKATGRIALQAAGGNVAYKQTLLDIAHCSWTISPLVKGDPPHVKSGLEKLISMVCSVATQLEPMKTPSGDPSVNRRILSYMIILGTFGKVCNFDEHVTLFRATLLRMVQGKINSKAVTAEQLKRLTGWKSESVSVLLLDLVIPYTKQIWNINLRAQALCSIGEICQQKTKHFTRADIAMAFKLPFKNKDKALTRVVLTQFRDFLATAERRSETGAEITVGEGAVHGAERLENSFAASDNDHATTHIARTFLDDIMNTALGKDEDLALPATDILVSISRQGLLHPKECGAALVALSTSLTPLISAKASAEHQKIHLQHETMFEKEYKAAVTLAFKYQSEVFNDPRGALDTTFKPKMQLLFEALKMGSRKTLKKFITNLFQQLHFDLSNLDASGTIPEAILFARFCLENCAFFDYAKLDEVILVILTIENIVLKQIGPSVALAIETEMPEQPIEQQVEEPPAGVPLPVGTPENPSKTPLTEDRLRQLTTASVILHMLWETRIFLRRAYNLPVKFSAKDMLKPAIRMNLVTRERDHFWERCSSLPGTLADPEAMKNECKELAEIINIDKEHGVEEEDADASEQLARVAAGYETPDDNEGDAPVATSGKNRKRKSSAPLGGNTPKKPRSRAGAKFKSKRSSRTPDDYSD